MHLAAFNSNPIPSLTVDVIFCVETKTENIMGLSEKVVKTQTKKDMSNTPLELEISINSQTRPTLKSGVPRDFCCFKLHDLPQLLAMGDQEDYTHQGVVMWRKHHF